MGAPDEVRDTQPEGRRVFRVEQDVIDASCAWELRPTLLKELYSGGPELCIDLSRVNFIDSSGLGMLVGVLKEARALGGDLRLINASRPVRRVLQVTGLEMLFEAEPVATGAGAPPP